MKPHIALLVLAATILGCSDSVKAPSTGQVDSNPEDKYFEARDAFIRQFEGAPGPVDDRPALSELEKQMKAIVGPVNVEGFPGEGSINLQTLIKELGFGQVDGLTFRSSQEYLFVTTDRMLNKYLAESPELPKDLASLSKTGEFYRLAFSGDAAVTYYVEIPVESTTTQSYVHAFLGVTAQDSGPFIPKEIFVFVADGERVLSVYSHAEIEITEIPQCRSEWEALGKKSSEALEIYRSSGLKDRQAIDDNSRYEEQAFEAYYRCYGREAKNQKFFVPLQKQAQSIVDRLQKNQISSR